MIRNTLPLGLIENPRLDQWIEFPRGRVRLKTGKVELGQGILTALVQIAACELAVEPGRIQIVSGDTSESPSEGFTAGSMSVENSGASIRLVAAQARSMLLHAAAQRLGCDASALGVENGSIVQNGAYTGIDYWELAAGIDFSARATGSAPVKPQSRDALIGSSLPRLDLPAKVFGIGAAFIHDSHTPDTLHARVIRQPRAGAKLANASELVSPVEGAEVYRHGNFVALLSADEAIAIAGAERLASKLTWTGGRDLDDAISADGWIASRPTTDITIVHGKAAAKSAVATRLSARYTKPFLAHASIGPSCALAHFENDELNIWTPSQGVFFLRTALAHALGLEAGTIRVHHVQGAGCYGHNGADDVACDAAIIALSYAGRTVRVQWSREDELSASPLGTAMVVAIDAELDAQRRPIAWTSQVWSGPHVQRPGVNGGVNLLGAYALPNPPAAVAPIELPEAAGYSGLRNARLHYDVPQQTIFNHLAHDIGVRTSSMRGLGAFANVFAIESFIDELAVNAGVDPVRYRLSLTGDARIRAVIEKAASMANWGVAPRQDAVGHGFAFSRYKNRAGYLALVVELHVDEEVRLQKVWCAVDAGLVVSPDGVRNQVEGGIIQAASWTLKEQVKFEGGRIASRGWDGYPILKFSEVPEIEIEIMDCADQQPLGVGEVAQGPTAAAIANAVADALGIRIRDLPLTRDRIIAAAL